MRHTPGSNWLLGPKQNFSVDTGFSRTRIGRGSDAYSPDTPSVLPIFRSNIGIAF